MNNVEKMIELIECYAYAVSDVCSVNDQGTPHEITHELRPLLDAKDKYMKSIRTNLEAMEADRVRLLEALKASRETLQRANDSPREIITDTIWHTSYETLFDFMDAVIAKSTGETS